MLKIEKRKKVRVPGSWLIISADFASLQARLAFADAGINPQGVDPIAYEIFGEKGHRDFHSATTVGTFCKPVNFQIIEIENNVTGEKHIFGEEQKIRVKRKGLIGSPDETVIKGKEFLPTDDFVAYA